MGVVSLEVAQGTQKSAYMTMGLMRSRDDPSSKDGGIASGCPSEDAVINLEFRSVFTMKLLSMWLTGLRWEMGQDTGGFLTVGICGLNLGLSCLYFKWSIRSVSR